MFFHYLLDLMLPFFPEEVNNVTVKVGQNAVLQCKVENLNSYKVINKGFSNDTKMNLKVKVKF